MKKCAPPTSPRRSQAAPPAVACGRATAGTSHPVVANVHYQPTIPPLADQKKCKCGPEHTLVYGMRLVPAAKGRGASIPELTANICLACGTIQDRAGKFAHWWHALSVFWKEWGWHRGIGGRLIEFADRFTHDKIESFNALAHGFPPAGYPRRRKRKHS